MKIVDWLVRLAFVTASCDVILTIKVGGTIRFTQLVTLLLMVFALGRMAQTGNILWPRGGTGLAIWAVLQGLLITQSVIPDISVQLYVLLLFFILGMFALLQLYGRSLRPEVLMRAYLWSFVAVGGFGLLQFITPILHLGGILVVQWIIHDRLPRISGFNYEPSYFATYMIMGWIMLVDLRVTGARITANRKWWWFSVMLTVVFFLSTSKTAWIFLIVEAVARLIPVVYRRSAKHGRRILAGNLIVPLPGLRAMLIAIIFAFLMVLGFSALSRVLDPTIFLAGSGLANTPAHSLNERVREYNDTLTVFKEHPWIGRSIGGTSGRVAEIEGSSIHSVDDLRAHWAFPVPLDVLTSSGILGILPLLWFFYATTLGERRRMRMHWDDDRAKWLHALIRALAYEWLCLLVDQNVLRVYLWFHIAMVVVIGYNMRFVPARPSMDGSPEALATA